VHASTAVAASSQHPTPTPLRTFIATVAYDGTGLAGFQLQARPGGGGSREPPTVQGALEAALCAVSGAGWVEEASPTRARPPPPLPAARAALALQGAGRTDAGVHARGQCVSFRAPARLAGGVGSGAKPLAAALNALLPPAIRVTAARPAPPDFSARFSCLSKTYVYYIAGGVPGGGAAGCGDPLLPRYAALTRAALDLGAMQEAAALLVGTHDFSGFATTHGGTSAVSGRLGYDGECVRTLSEARVVEVGGRTGVGSGAGGLWHPPPPPTLLAGGGGGGGRGDQPLLLACVFGGDGFLFRQVRHMAAALMAVGSGRLPLAAVAAALEDGPAAARARGGGGRGATAGAAARGWTVAPAAGLFLQAALYPPFPADLDAPMHGDVPHLEDGTVDTVALAARTAARAAAGEGKGEGLVAVRTARAARTAAALASLRGEQE